MHAHRLIPRFHPRVLAGILISGQKAAGATPTVRIPHVSSPPRLEDFEDMTPRGNSTELAKVTDFIQKEPSDGRPATQRTHLNLGYDSANLYAHWVCWDNHLHGIRTHLSRRVSVTPPDDDYIQI